MQYPAQHRAPRPQTKIPVTVNNCRLARWQNGQFGLVLDREPEVEVVPENGAKVLLMNLPEKLRLPPYAVGRYLRTDNPDDPELRDIFVVGRRLLSISELGSEGLACFL